MLEQFSQLVMSLHRGCREQPVEAFQDWAFEQVKAILPFDSALWMTGTLTPDGSDGVFHTHHLHKQPLQLLADWARTEGRTVFSRKVFATPGITCNCVTSQDFGPALAAHARRYRIEHILATTSIDPVAALHELISIYRADPKRPFTEAELLLQQSLVPHLAETWRINRVQHLAYAGHPGCAGLSCAAAADAKGVLHVSDRGFTRLLQEEWPDWRGPSLPPELMACVDDTHRRYVGRVLAVGLSDMHDLVLLRGRRRSRVDNLSQREQQVAKHFSAGRTHKEIAKILALAPATIRNHLTTTYNKLGVANKAELVNLLRQYD